MKIIVSGCTFLQVKPKRRQVEKIDVPQSIVQALEAMGHEVEWRKIALGEDLSGYDLLWVGLAPFNSLNARAGNLGALWALGQENVPVVGFFDDWQFPPVFNAARNIAKNCPEILSRILPTSNEYLFASDPHETVVAWQDWIKWGFEQFLTTNWWNRITPVIPAYPWGDRSIVRQKMPPYVQRIWSVDPTPTIFDSILTKVEPSLAKERRWTLAALMPHDKWMDKLPNDWPIELIGSKKLNGQRLRTEVDVLQRYNANWGALSPPYFSAGSGWWRSRFLYSARVGSVLVCDKGEGASLGRAYNLRVPQVEAATDDALLNLAMAQRDALRPHITSMDYFHATLSAIIADAVQRHDAWRQSREVPSTT